jgi:hypothetical protein
MIRKYRGKVSASREKEMKKDLAEIKLELETLLTAKLSVGHVDGANSAVLKGSELLTTLQAAEFARLELLRMLERDNNGFLNEQRAAFLSRERCLVVRKWANEQDQRIRELIDVGDQMFLAS